jgi:hypothetical protein
VIAGLGWVSVTGPGSFKVRVTAPKDTLVGLRPALLPYEAPLTTVSFTGGRLKRKGAIKRVVNGRKGTLGDVKRNAQEKAGGKKRKFSAWKLRAGVGNAAGNRRDGLAPERAGPALQVTRQAAGVSVLCCAVAPALAVGPWAGQARSLEDGVATEPERVGAAPQAAADRRHVLGISCNKFRGWC